MVAEENERIQREQEKYEHEQNKLSKKFKQIYEDNRGEKVCIKNYFKLSN